MTKTSNGFNLKISIFAPANTSDFDKSAKIVSGIIFYSRQLTFFRLPGIGPLF